ncbi:MAG: hypothetical protein ACYCY7_13510 [Gallionella sp.]
MSIAVLLDEFREKFKDRGSFSLERGVSISVAVRLHEVSDKYGFYVISSTTLAGHEIIYIGKAGTVANDGNFKKQGLRKRLKNKQGDQSRVNFFRDHSEKNNLSGLNFEWFVTFDDDDKSIAVLPVLAEAQLLQAYFSEQGRLPELNASA